MNDYPFPMKGSKPVLPQVGEKVYVPSRREPLLIGGLGTVLKVQGPKSYASLEILEHPGVTYHWRGLQVDQVSLHVEFQGRPARMPTDEEVKAIYEEKEAKRRAEEEADRKKWAPRRFNVVNGALLEVPVWSVHKRARNWAAIVDIDPLQPGGLSRFWLNRGRGMCKYIVPDELRLYAAVEFAADYVRGSGWKDPERWYGIVTEIAEDHLTIQPCKDAMAAVLASREKQVTKERPAEAVAEPEEALREGA